MWNNVGAVNHVLCLQFYSFSLWIMFDNKSLNFNLNLQMNKSVSGVYMANLKVRWKLENIWSSAISEGKKRTTRFQIQHQVYTLHYTTTGHQQIYSGRETLQHYSITA